MSADAASSKSRLLFIDNLRAVVVILVMMVHLSVTYGGEGSWYYKEGKPDPLSGIVLTLHNGVNQSFFMGCLFLISGYFTPASFDRKGPRRFLLDRIIRLGIPMLVYDLVIHPFMIYWLVRNGVIKLGGIVLHIVSHRPRPAMVRRGAAAVQHRLHSMAARDPNGHASGATVKLV